jgi:uncharacterized membrane protein YfcA
MMGLGGVVKGALGVGLPLVAVPLLSLIIPAPQAIGLLVVPVLVSNMLQARQGGRLAFAIRRFGPLMAGQLVATLLAVHWSQQLSVKGLNIAIALTVISAVVIMVLQPSGEIPVRHQRWVGPVVGAVAGAMGGLSSLTGPLLITYLMALRLGREEFVGSISIIYLFGAVPMYAAMLWWDRFGWAEVGWSCLGLLPVYVGMKLGGRLRGRMSEELFRRALLGFLTLLSVMLIFN